MAQNLWFYFIIFLHTTKEEHIFYQCRNKVDIEILTEISIRFCFALIPLFFAFMWTFAYLQHPQEPDPWTEPFEANELGNACPQGLGNIGITHPTWDKFSEDCLNLNIYTPWVCQLNLNIYTPWVCQLNLNIFTPWVCQLKEFSFWIIAYIKYIH